MALEWLTYSAAAERLGISPEAVRQRAIRHEWTRRTGNDGKAEVRIDVDELRAASQLKPQHPTDGQPFDDRPTGGQKPVELLADVRTIEALDAHIATLKTMFAKVEHEAERERARTVDEWVRADAERERADTERDRADGIAAELARVRVEGAENVASVEHDVAELRKVVEAMKAPAAEARAREVALESRIEAMRAEAAALRDRPWWRRLAG